MRGSCLNCGLKHLAQASVLIDEARLGYPAHWYLACGHMAEAESELLNGYSGISVIIRNHRVKMMEGGIGEYTFEIMELIELLISELLISEKGAINEEFR